jgi:hypothetical protein
MPLWCSDITGWLLAVWFYYSCQHFATCATWNFRTQFITEFQTIYEILRRQWERCIYKYINRHAMRSRQGCIGGAEVMYCACVYLLSHPPYIFSAPTRGLHIIYMVPIYWNASLGGHQIRSALFREGRKSAALVERQIPISHPSSPYRIHYN